MTHHIRLNYDRIAHLYDQQPYRAKNVDSYLLQFLKERTFEDFADMSILDMACGTGNQQVANRPHLPGARLVGLDLFHGMLRQAVPKSRDILWVHATCEYVPFPGHSFDFISNHFAFHHVQDKAAMLKEVFCILKPGGRFVMINLCPREMQEWIYYKYFPEALETDLHDFWPREQIITCLQQHGFAVQTDLEYFAHEQPLQDFFHVVEGQHTCSQLMTISDTAYQVGFERLKQDMEIPEKAARTVNIHWCMLTVIADKPGSSKYSSFPKSSSSWLKAQAP